jgi:hypothetical protein
MTWSTTLPTAIAFLCGTAAAIPPPVTVVSPCECRDNHGKGRWAVKNDLSTPPTDASAIQSVTPSDMYGWPAIDVQLTWQSDRTGIENKWFALTGRVVAVKVEADGAIKPEKSSSWLRGMGNSSRDGASRRSLARLTTTCLGSNFR